MQSPPITGHRQVSDLLSEAAVVNSDFICVLMPYIPSWHTCHDRHCEIDTLSHPSLLPCCAGSDQSTKYSLPDNLELHEQKASQREDRSALGKLSRSGKHMCPVPSGFNPAGCAAGCNGSLSNCMLQMGWVGITCSIYCHSTSNHQLACDWTEVDS